MFDWIIYDDSGNIISTSIFYIKDGRKTNQFIKLIMKKEHNSDDLTMFSKYILDSRGTITPVVNNTNESYLMLISASIIELNKIDTSKIHVLIIEPSYISDNNSKRVYNDDTIFEFILDN